MKTNDAPIKWILNQKAAKAQRSDIITRLVPLSALRHFRIFHRQIPG